ncbi:MAG TPA: polysaccharide biosynthesis/export family protein [Bradyrhizobium sp.]
MLLLAVALAAAGCASQPVAYVQMPPGQMQPSIDTMTYGAPAPAPAYQPGYRAPSAATYAYPASTTCTGLLTCFNAGAPSAYPAGAGYAYQAEPRYAYPAAAAPVASPAPLYNATAMPAPPPAITAQSPYTLDSGDRLRIVVFGQDGLTNSYLVDASGHIAMPLIGSVMAKGATTDQLSGRIAEKLRDGFIREPHVAVEVEAYRPFFILGEVTAPGQYPYVANMTAETAVAIAGGFAPRAVRQSVVLIRNFNGQQMRMTVPLGYQLRPGDTINVQERWF